MGQPDITTLPVKAHEMLEKALQPQCRGDPRASFPKDVFSRLKSEVLGHESLGKGCRLLLKGGETKELKNYTWLQVEAILNK